VVSVIGDVYVSRFVYGDCGQGARDVVAVYYL